LAQPEEHGSWLEKRFRHSPCRRTQPSCPVEPVSHLEQGNSFLQERSGNVLENKGALWKKPEEAGMYMKIKEIRV
jgi:hypothetical protein